MKTSRRAFAKSLAALAACPPLVPFAEKLSEAEREVVETNLKKSAPQLERLRAVPLTNADEPHFREPHFR